MRRLCIPLCALPAVCIAVAGVRAADWPQWRGPGLSGVSEETDWTHQWPPQGPPVAWKAAVGTGFSSVAVSDGRLLTMGNEDNTDTVFCLDAATGKPLWKHSYECPLDDRLFEGGPTSTPTIDEGRVYTLSRQGHLFCFQAETGEILWSKNVRQEAGVRLPGWGLAGSPLVHGDLLVLTVGEAGTALDKKTGKLVWTSADKEAGYASPVPVRHGDRRLVLVPSGKFFHAVDVQTGKEAWRHRWLTNYGCNAAEPIESEGQVFLSSGYNRGSALLRLTDAEPEVVWETKEFQNQFSSSVLLRGYLYGIHGSTDGKRALKCVEFKTGKVQWSEEGFSPGSLAAAGDRLIVLGEQGELVIVEASPGGFKALARAQVLSGKCWTVPVLSGGRIYCRNAEGDLVCLDVRMKP